MSGEVCPGQGYAQGKKLPWRTVTRQASFQKQVLVSDYGASQTRAK